jgi:hypothetical protein
MSKKNKKTNNSKSANDIFLNGPVNYFKLTKAGTEINLFMDLHAPINRQRKCEDYDAKDIDKYLNKVMTENDNTNTNLDFFLEINPTSVNSTYKYFSNDNYLQSIRKMFSKLYKEKHYDSKTPLQSVRLHYMDIRDYASFNDTRKLFINITSELDTNKLDNINIIIRDLSTVKNILFFIGNMIKAIIDGRPLDNNLSKKQIDYINMSELQTDSSGEKLSQIQILDIGLYQILEKILTDYEKSKNKDKIIQLFNTHYIDTSNYVINELTDLIMKLTSIDKSIDEYVIGEKITFEQINPKGKDCERDVLPYYYYPLDKYKKECNYTIDKINVISTLVMKMGTIIMDCYFLRRLIDNQNITKSIVYTGSYHTVVYLWFLIKYCNYNIEDYFYMSPNMTVKKLVDLISRSDYLDIMEFVIPNRINQCVKIKKI